MRSMFLGCGIDVLRLIISEIFVFSRILANRECAAKSKERKKLM